jgi:hypothetical protein
MLMFYFVVGVVIAWSQVLKSDPASSILYLGRVIRNPEALYVVYVRLAVVRW